MDKEKLNFEVALTLALAVATSWEEDDKRYPAESNQRIIRGWVGYKYEILQSLEERGLVRTGRSGRSLQITEEGKRVGTELLRHLKDGHRVFDSIKIED